MSIRYDVKFSGHLEYSYKSDESNTVYTYDFIDSWNVPNYPTIEDCKNCALHYWTIVKSNPKYIDITDIKIIEIKEIEWIVKSSDS